MNAGVYLALFRLPRARAVTVGRLGRFRFPAGVYVYVGSAQRNLQSRLARHARRRKLRRWQIDYLSVHAEFLGALVLPGPKRLECRLAAVLATHYPRALPRFGASDCRCGGHLFYQGPAAPFPASRTAGCSSAATAGRGADRGDHRACLQPHRT